MRPRWSQRLLICFQPPYNRFIHPQSCGDVLPQESILSDLPTPAPERPAAEIPEVLTPLSVEVDITAPPVWTEPTATETETVLAPTPAPAPRVSSALILREILETLILTVVIYLVVNFATGRFRIESVSMNPTLQPGEYVLVDKISYLWSAPQRGDILVFHHPAGDRDLIKRLIGLPGETIEISGGVVKINGQALDEPYIAAPPTSGGTWTLAPDQFFMMGDNRNNSSDSRAWGPLDKKFIVGKMILIYWPPANWGLTPHYTYAATP